MTLKDKRSLNEGFKLLKAFVKAGIDCPELSPDKVLIIDEKTMAKIITPKRVEMITAIRTHKPKNVNDLANILKRKQEAVSRDLSILHNYGVLDFLIVNKTKVPKIEKPLLLIPFG